MNWFPDFISKPPLDAFNEKPLSYRRDGDEFILYSVGVNHEARRAPIVRRRSSRRRSSRPVPLPERTKDE
ncbi:MAG: hypothetical protein ACKVHE_20540 [Planctomycetales bacterium]